jgi:hypothetical protein
MCNDLVTLPDIPCNQMQVMPRWDIFRFTHKGNDEKFPDDDISQFLVVRFRTYAYAECY